MNILIVKTSAIGDVTHTLPALNAIRKTHPDATITWLVEEAASDMVIGHRQLDRVLVSRRKKWIQDIRHFRFKTAFREIMAFVRELRDTKYDLLIDFQGLLKSSVWVWLAKADRKAGFGKGMEHQEGSCIFLNERTPAIDMDIHAADRELHLVSQLGMDTSGEILFHLPVTEEHQTELKAILEKEGVVLSKPIVAINPMAGWPTKLWLVDRFAQVADQLIEEFGVTLIFTGSGADEAAISEIQKSMKHSSYSLAGKTSLLVLAALYEKSALVITTDTGPMHIAAAMDRPIVALFGPTAPWRTGPYTSHAHVVRKELDCMPCLKRECEINDCMRLITVADVMAKSREVLGTEDTVDV